MKKLNNFQIKELYKLCENHDWFFVYSDCGETYSRGLNEENNLIEKCKGTTLFKDFKDYKFSGENFNTEKLKKPRLEDYLNKETLIDKCLMRRLNCNINNCNKLCKYHPDYK